MTATAAVAIRGNGRKTTSGPDTPALIATLSGVIKWFNPHKGFGFIKPDDGQPDALLHATCLQRGGYEAVYRGARVVFEAARRPRGLCCVRILSMDESTAIRTEPAPHPSTARMVVREVFGPETMVVKRFDKSRGFGFFVFPGESDVFVHAEVLRRCGISDLVPGQTMTVLYGINEADLKRRLVATEVSNGRTQN